MCCFDHTPEGLGVLADFLEETGHARHADVRELVQAAPSLPPHGWPWPLASGAWWRLTVRRVSPGPRRWPPHDDYPLTWTPDAETEQGQAVAATLSWEPLEATASRLADIPRNFEALRFRAIAALLGRTRDELEAHDALRSGSDSRLVECLQWGAPPEVVRALRERDPRRCRRLMAEARRREKELNALWRRLAARQ
jgi:hypothetical protein